jgi:hypothetical protein
MLQNMVWGLIVQQTRTRLLQFLRVLIYVLKCTFLEEARREPLKVLLVVCLSLESLYMHVEGFIGMLMVTLKARRFLFWGKLPFAHHE